MRQPPSSTIVFPLESFTQLLDRCQWPLSLFLRGLVGDEEQARDLMQDAFYDGWRVAQQGSPPFDRPEDEDGMRRWLFHAAYNRAISALRRRRLIQWLPLEKAHLEVFASGSFENDVAESQLMRAALAKLPPTDAACLLLIIIQGFTAAEVGRIIGATPQAVAKRFARAKVRLRDEYLAQNSQPSERSRR